MMKKNKRSAAIIEALEPRLLYSADAFAGAVDSPVIDDPLAASLNNAVAQQDLQTSQPQALHISGNTEDDTDALLTAEPVRKELVFIDSATPDYQQLLDDLLAANDSDRLFDVVMIDSDVDGLQLITDTLSGYQNLDAVHIISHGSDGNVQLGNTTLNQETLNANLSGVGAWGNAFSADGDLLFYGCDVASTSSGQNLLTSLANLTGADVAASDDLTGSALLGGDWDLEYQVGAVETDIAFSSATQENWSGTLDITTGLQGHWTLDADASDSSGNTYTGTLAGDAFIDTTPATNQVGAGKLSLDGSGDYVDLSANVGNFSGFTEGTVSAWVNLTDASENTIFNLADSASEFDLVKFGVEGGQLKWLNLNDAANDVITYSTATINDGNWHHVAVTVNGSGNTLYIDGVAASVTFTSGDASIASFFDDITGVDEMDIGRSVRDSTVEAEYNGLLDEVRVYDRALTSSDIAELASSSNTPTISNLSGDSLAYAEGDGAVVIEQGTDAVVTDADSADFNTGTLTVSFQAGSDNAEDILSIRNEGVGAGQIGVSGSNVTYAGTTIGTFTGGTGGTDLVITFNSVSATPAAVTALVQNITYENTDTDDPTTGARTVRFVVTDGDGGTSSNYDTTVTVSAVNDAPTDIVVDTESTAEVIQNTYTTSNQRGVAIAAFSNGGYIATWVSVGQDGDGQGIYAQRFDVDGNKLGAEFLVNQIATDEQQNPSVSTFADGGFVIAWQDQLTGSSAWVEARVYNADGTPASAETLVSPMTDDYHPTVLALDNTRFLVTWNTSTDVVGQIYDRASVTSLAAAFTIGDLDTAGKLSSETEAALLSGGGFAVSWQDNDGATNASHIRLFDSNGVATSADITLTGDGQTDVAGLSNGNVVVVYGDGGEISAQILNTSGTVVVSEFTVNSTTTGSQVLPTVTAMSDGGFLVAWQSDDGDGSGTAILSQRFDASGNAIGIEMLVNTTSANDQKAPDVIELASGEIRLAWTSEGQDGSSGAVVSRVVALGGSVAEDAANGTEVARATDVVDPDSGDTHTYLLFDNAGGRFAINPTTGQITVANNSLLDFETATFHNITVRVTDSGTGNLTHDEVVTINVTDANDPPVATGNTVVATEDVSLIIGPGDFSFSDDEGDSLVSVTITGLNLNGGTLTHSAGAVTVTNGMTVTAAQLADLTFTSANNDSTNSSFSYTVNDADIGITSATMNITVNAANDAPAFTENGDGITINTIGSGDDQSRAMVIQSDGKIVTVGYSYNGTNDDYVLVRYNSDGSLDTSFGGGDGIVVGTLGGSTERSYGVTLQSDGKILLTVSDFSDFNLLRYNSDGTIDTSFGGGDGIASANTVAGTEVPYQVIVQTDGKILVGGFGFNGDGDYAVVRFNANGTLDAGFGGGDGIVTTDIGGDDRSQSIALQSDGKILIGGYSDSSGNNDFVLVRYNADGTLDASFGGGDGIADTDISANSNDIVHSITLQTDGKILMVGQFNDGTGGDVAVARYNSDGSLDTSFGGGDGIVITSFPNASEAHSVAVQADGKIVVIGQVFGTNSDALVIRYNSDGSLDTSFGGGDGIINADIGGNDDALYGLALQTDGKIVVTGSSSNGSNDDLLLIRYNSDGTLDTSFGLDNTLDGTPTFTEDGSAVVLDADVNVRDAELDALNGASGDYDSASVILVRNGGASSEDVFSFNDGNGITLSGGNLIKNSQIVASFDITSTPGQLVISFTNANGETPTSADVDNILRQITYANSSDNPPASAQIDWTFDDGNSGAQGAGGALTAVGSTTVTITATNDDPTNANTLPTDITVTEDVASNVDISAIDISDVDENGGNLTVTLTTSTGGNLSATTAGGVTVGGSGTGTLTLTGTQANLNSFLNTASNVTYLHGTTNTNGNNADTIQVLVNDNSGTGGGTNINFGTVNVDISAVNDDPTNANTLPTDITVTEDVVSNINISLIYISDVDENGGNLTVTLTTSTGGNLSATTAGGVTVGGSATGTLTLTGTQANLNTFLNTASNVMYLHGTPGTNGNDADTIQVQVNDNGNTGSGGGTNINFGTVNVDITVVNNAPTITNLSGDNIAYDDGDGAVVIEQGADAIVADVDSVDFDTGNLTVSFQAGSDNAEDVLSIRNEGVGAGQIGVSGSNVTYAGTTIGTFTGGTGGTDLVITFNSVSATPVAVSALIQNITYENTDTDNPTTGARTVRFVLDDGDGSDSINHDTTVTVSGVNDDPINANTLPTDITVTEDVASNVDISAIDISDVDENGGNLTVTLTTSTGGNLSAATAGGVTVGGSGTGTLTLTGTQANLNSFLNTASNVTYLHGTTNTNGNNADTIQVLVNDNGNTGTGGGTNINFGTVNVDISAVNDAPRFDIPNFTEHVITTSASGANSVVTADVDGDGDMDVVSASTSDDTLAWYENDGSGNFTTHIIDNTVDGARAVTAVDVDGDGDMDVVSGSVLGDTISWYENDGSGNFTEHTISALADGAQSVAAVDVDGDGDIDVLSASFFDNKIAWYENDGSENFTTRVIDAAALGAFSVSTADVDGDGDMDVLAATITNNTIAWYENDGSENFTLHTINTNASSARSVTATDLDGDGDIDVLSASRNDDTIAWYENDGSENFTTHIISTTVDGAISVTFADVDGDGDIDVLSASADDDTIAWYENDGNENFTARTISTAADSVRELATADIDGDGSLDVVSVSSSDSKVAWYESVEVLDGAPSFTEGGAAVVLDADVNVRDAELDVLNGGSGDYDGASVTLVRNLGANSEDVLSFNDGNGITLSGGSLIKNSQIIASFDTTTTPGQLLISFTNANGETPTSADVDNILRQITYANSSDNPPATAQINWTFNDGNAGTQGSGGALNAVGSTTVSIVAVNDDPTNANTLPTDIIVTEDVASNVDISAIDISDVDENGGNLTVTLTTSTGGNLSATTAGGVTVGGSGTGTLTLTGTQANLNTFLNTASNVTYLHGTANINGNNVDTIQVLVNDNGNTGSGGGTNINFGTVNVDINAVNDVPVATGNTVIATEDVPLVIGAGDFSFSDTEGDGLVSVTITGLNLNGGTLTHSAGAVTVTNGMTVTAAQLADLTFTSASNDSTNSSFSYTVNDAGLGATPATMNITVNAVTPVVVETDEEDTDEDDIDETTEPDEIIIPEVTVIDPSVSTPDGEEALPEEENDQNEPTITAEAVTLGLVEIDLTSGVLADVTPDVDSDSPANTPAKFIDLASLSLVTFESDQFEPEYAGSFMNNDAFVHGLDVMNDEFDDAVEEDNKYKTIAKEAVMGISLSLSVGFISWVFRAGSLLACFMSVGPMWRQFDPLPILGEGAAPNLGKEGAGSDPSAQEDEPAAENEEVEALFTQEDAGR